MKAAIVNDLGRVPQLGVFAPPILGSGTGNFSPIPQLKKIVGDILMLAAEGKVCVETQDHAFAEIAEIWDLNKKSDVRSVIHIRR